MKIKVRCVLTGLVALAGLAGVGGCGDAAPSKAPLRTAPPFKKWSQLTKDEKIAVIEKNPVPNKEQMIELIKEGKQ